MDLGGHNSEMGETEYEPSLQGQNYYLHEYCKGRWYHGQQVTGSALSHKTPASVVIDPEGVQL